MKTEQQSQLDRALASIRAAEAGPTDDDLAAAPVLELWRPLANIHAAVVLWGQVTGHPRIGASTITTSRLIALDRQAGWARTYSRWYRLGEPFSEFEANVARDLKISEARKGVVSFELAGFVAVDDDNLVDRLLAAFIAHVQNAAIENRVKH
ncbi:DUF6634 family protein [Paracoccus saliphilus]|uniref:ATP-dependent Lon protease n=1 Tax=Paracoccus saliphilus TaxID=405559 RepID=A0AA45W8M8_9RHOB|nr:DUF6634 family protein [Paracoccus saliphilus]WCR04843.1 ATP-dependent Lon protease [Paracoccus saliphilus]SIT17948.1 hypothetical protein SAMN05421772_13314 [Paracoccus saliphilus]